MIKKILCLFLFTSLFTNSFSQIVFEKGYFIDNNNVRSEVLIKNVDWKNNPDKFQYKTASDETVLAKEISEVQEFGVYDYSRYISQWVAIDQSPTELSRLTTIRAPQFVKQKLALKVLVEGSASLYVYSRHDQVKYFFKVKDDSIKQLVYKEYFTENRSLAINKMYQQQLFMEINCDRSKATAFEKLRYQQKDMMSHFVNHNKCEGGSIHIVAKPKHKLFSVKLTPGIAWTKLVTKAPLAPAFYNVEFGSVAYRIGAELEWHLPFNKNRWSIVFEPSFSMFDAKGTNASNEEFEISFRTLTFVLGPRYTHHLNEQTTIFVNTLFLVARPLTNEISYRNNQLEPSLNYTLAFGAGASYKKIGVEVRYPMTYDILPNHLDWRGDYSQIMLLLGVRIF